jgi:hypothetical protein
LLIAPFAVVENTADRRLGGGGDFDQVESGFTRQAQGLGSGGDSNLFILLVDEADRRYADLLVVTKVRRNRR